MPFFIVILSKSYTRFETSEDYFQLNFFLCVVTDVQQEKFFNSINQIVINTPSVFVTDADKQHTIDNLKTTNSYRKKISFGLFD